MNRTGKKLAVLIDVDNADASRVAGLMAAIEKFGEVAANRAYGDWTMPQLASWKQATHDFLIRPLQQYRDPDSHASDGSLVVGAMDLLHAGRMDGICIVSSGIDYIGLATRVREAGLPVYGFGSDHTPEAFRAACDEFVVIDIHAPQSGRGSGGGPEDDLHYILPPGDD